MVASTVKPGEARGRRVKKTAAMVYSYADLVTRTGRRETPVRVDAGMSLHDVLSAAMPGHKLDHFAIARDGQVIRSIDAKLVKAVAGDILHVAPIPGLEPVEWIALGIALLSAAASAYLISQVPHALASQSDTPEQQRFGFAQFSNDAFSGDLIQVVCGRITNYGGKIIAQVPIESPDGSGDSRLKLLISYGFGEIGGIGNQDADFDNVPADQLTGINLNGQPIAIFPGTRCSGRMGTDSQAVLPAFADTETLSPVGVGGATLRNTSGAERTAGGDSGEAFSFTTTSAVTAVVVRIQFYSGLYAVASNAQVDSRTAKYRVRTRLVAGAWSAWSVVTVRQDRQSPFFSAFRIDHLNADVPAVHEVECERVSIEPTDATAVDAMRWDSIVEIVYGDNTYPGFALLAVETIASEQIQSVPAVTADVQGLANLRLWDGVSDPSSPVFTTGWSDNPADIVLEVLTNTKWGGGVRNPDFKIDFASLFEWRTYCAQMVTRPSGRLTRMHTFNKVLEQAELTDMVRMICRAGRCIPTTVGETWRFVVDKTRSSPVEVFTDGSIARDDSGALLMTYRREYALEGLARQNQITFQFDNAFTGVGDAVSYPKPGEQWLATETSLPSSLRLEGVTDPEEAMAEAVYEARKLRYLTRTVRFTTTKPFVAIQPGDRFDLAMDLAGYGRYSGRVGFNSTAGAVCLDRTLALDPRTHYPITIIHLDNSIEVRQIYSGDTDGSVPRLTPLKLSTVLAQRAQAGAEYVVHDPGGVEKPFVCTKVSLTDSDKITWEIEGIEYVDGIYNPDPNATVDLPIYSSLNGPGTPPGPVTSLRAFARQSDDGRSAFVELSWDQLPRDVQHTSTFRVYRRISGTTTWLLTSNAVVARRSAVLEIFDLSRGYEFVVVAVSIGGAFLSPYDPRNLIARIVFSLAEQPPGNPTGLTLTRQSDGSYTLSWDAVTGALAYQVLSGRAVDGTVNDGAYDCYVFGRTEDTQLAGLWLAAGLPHTFRVRSVGRNGRLSFTASEVTEASPLAPPSTSATTYDYDLSTDGTLTNLVWNGTTSRLELDDPTIEGVWLGPEETPPAFTLQSAMNRLLTANDSDDFELDDNPFLVPSLESDQWGIYDISRELHPIMPPYPDAELGYKVEIRTNDGVIWGDWLVVAPGARVYQTYEKVQIRVTISRQLFPNRPALARVSLVVTA